MSAPVAVLGAGNGAHAFAGDLAVRGHRVRLYNKFADELRGLQANGGVTLEGARAGFGALDLVTTEIGPVVAEADIILVVVPATAHAFMAEACAPHLRDGQLILLCPGRTGGALEVRQRLQALGVTRRLLVAEAQTLLFVCRISGPGRVRVTTLKRDASLAALPARDTPEVLRRIHPLYPQFSAAADVLETGLGNMGAVLHPATTLLGTGRIESGAPFEFYRDMTPSIALAIEAIDAERMAVARAYGVKTDSASDWLAHSYAGITGDTLYQRIQSNTAYHGIVAPRSLDTRYLWEDVPTGLVPMIELGGLAGVAMPVSTAIVNLACAVSRRDFWGEGRNARRLGLCGLDVSAVKAFITSTGGG
jgi:opine dehydrogenase